MSLPEHPQDPQKRRLLKAAAGAVGVAGLRALGLVLPPGAMLLSGCTKKRDPEQMLHRIVVAVDERIQTLDPAYQNMALDSYVICNIYDPLTWYNRKLDFIPRLATSWDSPDEGKTWIFKIRPNVLFHDGTPCDAQAVKFHFDRIKDPATNSKRRAKLANLTAIEAVDPLTVRFKMNQAFSVWPVVLRDSFAGVVSPAAVRKYGNEKFTEHPVGTGPYMVAEQESGDRVLLKKNPHYWRADDYPVEEVEFVAIREPTTRLIMLEQGTIDVCNISFAHTELAEHSKKVEVLRTPSLAVRYVGFNNMKPPFNDVRVRRACNLAINRDELVKYAFRGNADPLLGPLPTVLPAFNKKMKTYGYDPDEAKRLLKEAGLEKGIDAVLWSKDDISDTNLGVVVAEQLRHVGIRVQIIRYDRNVYWDKFDPYQTLNGEWFPTKSGVFDMYAAGWVGGEHPHGYLDPLFRSSSNSNSSFYKNQHVNDLLLQSLNTVDDAKRQQIYDELQEVIVNDAPWIFAYSTRAMWGVNPRVKNVHIHPAGEYEFDQVLLTGGSGRV